MRDIEQKASAAWGSGQHARAAWDFLRVHVPFHPRDEDAEMQSEAVESADPGSSDATVTAPPKPRTDNNTRSNGDGRPRNRNRPDKRTADRSSEPSTPNGDPKRRK